MIMNEQFLSAAKTALKAAKLLKSLQNLLIDECLEQGGIEGYCTGYDDASEFNETIDALIANTELLVDAIKKGRNQI